MVAKGWAGVIVGFIILVGFLLLWSSNKPSIDEANKIRADGFMYSGESVLTEEQYNHIKQYKGFHDGEVEIVELSPLTVKYNFGTLEDLAYLTKVDWGFGEKTTKPVFSDILPILLGSIGILQIIIGFTTIDD
jgi:hypothetical protein